MITLQFTTEQARTLAAIECILGPTNDGIQSLEQAVEELRQI